MCVAIASRAASGSRASSAAITGPWPDAVVLDPAGDHPPEAARHEAGGRADEPGEPVGVGDRVDDVVQVVVRPLEVARVVGGVRLDLLVDQPQCGDLLVVDHEGGTRGELAADESVDEICILDVPARDRHDAEATVRLLADPAVLGQQQQRLPDGRDAGADALGERREAQQLTRRHLAGDDQLSDMSCRLVFELESRLYSHWKP